MRAAATACFVLLVGALAAPALAEESGGEPGSACASDGQCAVGSICQEHRCVKFEKPTRVLLYRHDGASTRFLPFYFSRTGAEGHRIVAPLYWHYWGREEQARVLAPFYFHFAGPGHALTVVPP